ncbi:MAG: hypothetical protein A3J62_02285 [Candidatus Buchananbacteria bacterium RIFCSPHIGHO2_02_FULL_38_8]|nr:MAG: hypothetical protein A3J62_02285 [Candidatus Buchananbacteria bacterium RIFCSPHIGHO2_02_FULL_38_8]
MKNINSNKKETATVCFSGVCIEAEITKTPAERARGLMDRKSLDDNKGIIFIFEKEGLYRFTMKNTLIPLDIIWLDSNFKIVHLEHAVPCPSQSCKSYPPNKPARYVVEVNSGFTTKNNIKVGDLVAIELPPN